jgi:hypothetical protein
MDLPEHWRYSSARNYAALEGLIELFILSKTKNAHQCSKLNFNLLSGDQKLNTKNDHICLESLGGLYSRRDWSGLAGGV